MSLDAIKEFSKVLSGFRSHKLKLSNSPIVTNKTVFDAFKQFYSDFSRYTNSVLKSKKYTDSELSQYIFETSVRYRIHYKEFLKRSLFSAQLFLDHYYEKITEENISQYIEAISVFETDLEELISDIEVNYLHTASKIRLRSFRKKNKELRDVFNVAKSLFFFDDAKELSDFYLFDLRPYSIFPIRQLIEVYGKEIIGLIYIEDEKGNLHRDTSIAWKFIKQEIDGGSKSRIEIPFDIEIILKVQKWTNTFIHTTVDAPYYVIYNAIRMMFPLFKSELVGLRQGVKTYDGKISTHAGFADVKISDFEAVKKSFCDFINSPKSKKKYTPIWKEPHQVRSYILSL